MILAGLLGKLLDQLRSGTLGQQLTGFVEQHKHLLPLLAAAASWLPGGETGAEASAASRFDDADKKRAFDDHFEELFGQLSYAWFHGTFLAARDNIGTTLAESSHDHVIAVFLDDLDRCPKNRVKETLEAITLFLDLPGVCFYLVLYWRRVSEVLHDATGGRQAHFLQKIVQVEIDLSEVAEEGARNDRRRPDAMPTDRPMTRRTIARVVAASSAGGEPRRTTSTSSPLFTDPINTVPRIARRRAWSATPGLR